jgi:hypothetical protein
MSAAVHLDVLQPVTRGDCADGPRPCPWLRCKHHTLIERELRGEERRQHSAPWLPGVRLHPAARSATSLSDALSRLTSSCALDVVDYNPDGMDLAAIGAVLGISGEAARLIERRALTKLRHAVELRKADRDG